MQEDRCLLVLMNSPEDMSSLTEALPAAAAKRKRAEVLPGSCIRLQPLAPTASEVAMVVACIRKSAAFIASHVDCYIVCRMWNFVVLMHI